MLEEDLKDLFSFLPCQSWLSGVLEIVGTEDKVSLALALKEFCVCVSPQQVGLVENGELVLSGDKQYSHCKSRQLKGSDDTIKITEYLKLTSLGLPGNQCPSPQLVLLM